MLNPKNGSITKFQQEKMAALLYLLEKKDYQTGFAVFPKNRVQQPVLKEELEHSLIGNEFTPTFLNLKETFKNKAKKPLPFPEKVDYLS